MAKTQEKTQQERIYTIPLRKEWSKVSQFKRAKRAAKAVKKFLARHMKVPDRDESRVKLDRWLNMRLWQRGIRKPPAKVKVKVKREEIEKKGEKIEIVRAELAELPQRAIREREAKAKAEAEKKAAEKKKKEAEKKQEEKKQEAKPAEEKKPRAKQTKPSKKT